MSFAWKVQICKRVGGWYILRNWNIEDFDAKFRLNQIHVKYGVSPYFKVSVQPNPQFPKHSSITISPSGLGLPHKSYYYAPQNDHIQQAYKQLIRDVVITLSATRSEADKFGNDIFYYEKRIAEITPDTYDLQNPIKTYNLYKVSELKETVPTLPLQDILTAMFPESNVTDETEVIVTSPEYLSGVSQIVASTDRTTLNSYLIWTLVRNYLPYLSSEFVSTVDSFRSELFGNDKPLRRWEMCVNLLHKFMGIGIDAMLEKRNPVMEDTKTIIENVFGKIKNSVAKKLQKYKPNSDLYRHLTSKISSLKLQIGLPDKVHDNIYLKSYYSRLIVMKANLFDSVKNGFTFAKKLQEKQLTKMSTEDALISHIRKYPFEVSYSPSENTVIVPSAVLNAPVFESKYPRAVIYGRLGVQIANAVVSSIFPYDSAWTSDLKLLSPFHMVVNESISSANALGSCIESHITKQELNLEYSVNRTVLNAVKHLLAVIAAHDALENEAKEDSHIHQPSLEMYEDSELFFISYAQTKCSLVTKQQELYDAMVNFKIPQKSLLHLVAEEVPEFSTSFGCSSRSKCSDRF